MARSFLPQTITVVSLSVTLSVVTKKSCTNFSPVFQTTRNLTYSLSSHHWFHRGTTTMADCMGPKENLHRKARTSPYPGSKVERTQVPDDKVDWLIDWKNYSPVDYTAPSVFSGPKWADPEIGAKNFFPKFNEKDGQVERRSHSGLYDVENGRPRNPVGRTGLVGRGLLGRWGPNHAADPLITRWKRDGSGNKTAHPISGKNILQFIAIKRKDCGEWAIPGGMVDPGERLSAALKREFSEEALNSLQKTKVEKEEMEKHLNRLFSQDHFVAYKGYVDDPRNTDNAWMETEAINYHDESGEAMKNLHLEAGDDAGKVKWVDISEKLTLYASHSDFLRRVAEKRGAHWKED
ncbi:ADP-ribose pyrophosphatase, mitochondrial [Pantherophis guttatus]|uniref:ADP-ribose pyrophosphatase, mitochondrial n=1 Tax=Pantherophis guttatus TaxID=94885 RepID=A0A6P9DKP6_PANGU|nr:ADP-ribose pyrophosphatase, mitochondrial [Pantherophis guttatus]XP_034296343.1 ADP-ribose pyrophosphatase, mitochondrial [Pantherophis guttatus]